MPSFEYDRTITLSTPVSNLEDAIAWFRDTLGFEEIFKVPEAGWAEVTTSADGVSIGLEAGGTAQGRGSTPVFGVVDIDAARSELEGKGVRFEGETVELPAWSSSRRSSTRTATASCSRSRWQAAERRAYGARPVRAAAWSLAAVLLAGSAAADEGDRQAVGITYAHGTSYLEPLKYGPGFAHFDYVDPNAPKGGMVRVADRGTYDSFNGSSGPGPCRARLRTARRMGVDLRPTVGAVHRRAGELLRSL